VQASHLTRFAPVIFLLLWSGGFTVAKIGLTGAEPMTLLSLRYGCVVLLLAPFYLILKPALPNTLKAWRDLLWVGFLIQVMYFGMAYFAFANGASAGAVAIITSLQPLLVALIMPSVSNEVVSIRNWVGLFLGLLGATIVISDNFTIQLNNATSLFLVVISLFSITLATVWERLFGVAHHPVTSNLVQYIVGFAFTLPVALATESLHIDWSPSFVGALFYLVVCNSILGISLLLMMIRNGEATRVSALFFLVPPLSAIIALVILGEPISTLGWLGMLVAATGVWLAKSGKRKV
jgi:drug/metabolite transporter (DMT)-like permease